MTIAHKDSKLSKGILLNVVIISSPADRGS